MEEDMKEGHLEEQVKKKLEEENSKTFWKVLVVLGVFVAFFGAWLIISYNQHHFNYKGVNFEEVNEIAPYRTSIPVGYGNPLTGNAIEERNYYFYLRKDPRKTGEIPFEGKLVFRKDMVINSTGNLNCAGDGIIGVANLAKLYQTMGTDVIKDETADCDDQGRYLFLQMQEGNETGIKQTGPTCYIISVHNCDILSATERFMIESFVEFKEELNS